MKIQASGKMNLSMNKEHQESLDSNDVSRLDVVDLYIFRIKLYCTDPNKIQTIFWDLQTKKEPDYNSIDSMMKDCVAFLNKLRDKNIPFRCSYLPFYWKMKKLPIKDRLKLITACYLHLYLPVKRQLVYSPHIKWS